MFDMATVARTWTHFSLQVDPQQQQDENWLFGKIGQNKQGYFPAAYVERITYVDEHLVARGRITLFF